MPRGLMLWYYNLSLTEAQHNFHPARPGRRPSRDKDEGGKQGFKRGRS